MEELTQEQAQQKMAELYDEYQQQMQELMDVAYPPDEEGRQPELIRPKQYIKNSERLDELINTEMRMLGREGLTVDNLDANSFILETQLKALIGFLREEEIIPEDKYGKLDVFYKNLFLDKVRGIRTNIQRQAAERRIAESMGDRPNIVLPNNGGQ